MTDKSPAEQPQSPDFAHIDWGEDGQPRALRFGDVYFSRHDGLAETRHVFLDNNHLPRRFAQLSQCPAPASFIIAETGFGTGLNFLATWQLWLDQAPQDAQLHFISVEKYPLKRADLQRALELWPELASLGRQLLDAYPRHLGRGVQRLHFAGKVSLTLIIDDASCGFNHLLPSTDRDFYRPGYTVDAWFLDGFAPSKNPQMWSEALFASIARFSGPGTTAATFSAAGVVKRGLKAAGFAIEKVPGFGRKREMIRALWQETPALSRPATGEGAVGILQQASHRPGVHKALVIGAGLAGCHTARALAERGWQVDLLERREEIALEGSGNPQGLLYAKLSHRDETLPRWNLAALNYAQRHYRPYWSCASAGEPSGLIQLADGDSKVHAFAQIAEALGENELCRLVDASEATELAGIPLAHGGLYFPEAGWLNPRRLCQQLLDHPAICLRTNTPVDRLERRGDHWQALRQTQILAEAPVVILACAHTVKQFTWCNHLPLKPIRGQITFVPATETSARLKTALCGRGYIAPSVAQRHCIGATFNPGEETLALLPQDHEENLAHLQALSTELHRELAPPQTDNLQGRAAFRCATPDYLPVVGPLPRADAIAHDFAGLAKNARQRIARPATYWPGLYVNCGHGSRGLAYTPLAAEFLAALLQGEPWPLERSLANALHPARFLIRRIIRSQ